MFDLLKNAFSKSLQKSVDITAMTGKKTLKNIQKTGVWLGWTQDESLSASARFLADKQEELKLQSGFLQQELDALKQIEAERALEKQALQDLGKYTSTDRLSEFLSAFNQRDLSLYPVLHLMLPHYYPQLYAALKDIILRKPSLSIPIFHPPLSLSDRSSNEARDAFNALYGSDSKPDGSQSSQNSFYDVNDFIHHFEDFLKSGADLESLKKHFLGSHIQKHNQHSLSTDFNSSTLPTTTTLETKDSQQTLTPQSLKPVMTLTDNDAQSLFQIMRDALIFCLLHTPNSHASSLWWQKIRQYANRPISTLYHQSRFSGSPLLVGQDQHFDLYQKQDWPIQDIHAHWLETQQHKAPRPIKTKNTIVFNTSSLIELMVQKGHWSEVHHHLSKLQNQQAFLSFLPKITQAIRHLYGNTPYRGQAADSTDALDGLLSFLDNTLTGLELNPEQSLLNMKGFNAIFQNTPLSEILMDSVAYPRAFRAILKIYERCHSDPLDPDWVNQPSPQSHRYFLHQALYHQSAEVVELLLNRGARMDLVETHTQPPLNLTLSPSCRAIDAFYEGIHMTKSRWQDYVKHHDLPAGEKPLLKDNPLFFFEKPRFQLQHMQTICTALMQHYSHHGSGLQDDFSVLNQSQKAMTALNELSEKVSSLLMRHHSAWPVPFTFTSEQQGIDIIADESLSVTVPFLEKPSSLESLKHKHYLKPGLPDTDLEGFTHLEVMENRSTSKRRLLSESSFSLTTDETTTQETSVLGSSKSSLFNPQFPDGDELNTQNQLIDSSLNGHKQDGVSPETLEEINARLEKNMLILNIQNAMNKIAFGVLPSDELKNKKQSSTDRNQRLGKKSPPPPKAPPARKIKW